ncbi:MAG: DUF2203 family protein [Candidatus Lambdaproteobacteria bacterium]|nr:DUF2203 family protein [Candidatus Lambdaproteobacteria bacterium]
MHGKIFSYDEARALIDTVREKTEFANERLQAFRSMLRAVPGDSPKARKMNEWIETVIAEWSREILACGAVPKGLWTVDFDSGAGYFYCWTLGENDLGHFHNYEEGFQGRRPISDIQRRSTPHLLN